MKNVTESLLGQLIDHLFEHAGPSKRELKILERSSNLWQTISAFMADIGLLRADLESLVSDPHQPSALDKFNSLAKALSDTTTLQFNYIVSGLNGVLTHIAELKFLTQHGQAQDKPVAEWEWRDIILSRRSGAFVANLVSSARTAGNPELLAFSFGAISSYAANAVGSSYLNRVVGGPRRSHPYRSRVASYSVGAWLGKNAGDLTMPLGKLRSSLLCGAPNMPTLPPKVLALLESTLQKTYDKHVSTPIPDLNKAYLNLLRHLELLSSFTPLPIPQPIVDSIYEKYVATVSTKSNSGSEDPPPPPDPEPDTAGSDSGAALPTDKPRTFWDWVEDICAAIGYIALLLILLSLGGGKSDGGLTPSSDTSYSIGLKKDDDEMIAWLTSDRALVAVNAMFKLQCMLWDVAQNALKVLKLVGILYPEDSDLVDPRFLQFTAIPDGEEPSFPKREIAVRTNI